MRQTGQNVVMHLTRVGAFLLPEPADEARACPKVM